jgi:hypothetical protein
MCCGYLPSEALAFALTFTPPRNSELSESGAFTFTFRFVCVAGETCDELVGGVVVVAAGVPVDVFELDPEFEFTGALVEVEPVDAPAPAEAPIVAPVHAAPAPEVPVPAEPDVVLDVVLDAGQSLVIGVTEIVGVPEAPTPTFTLYVSLFAASVTVSAALEGVVDAALACTPALVFRPTLRPSSVWFAAFVAICNVPSG